MHLKYLELKNFRLFSEFAVQVPNKMILITGANAQGKTTLLEAIYFLATFSSFHASSDRQLIRFGHGKTEAVTEIQSVFTSSRDYHLNVFMEIVRDTNNLPRFHKKIKFENKNLRVNEAIGKFNAVLFLPEMTQIVDGSPNLRRKYIDMVIAQAIPFYMERLSKYYQAIQQRNALLKSIAEGTSKTSQLQVWDQQLARLGAYLIKTRDTTLQELEIESHNNHFQLSHGLESLTIRYQPSFDPAQFNTQQEKQLFSEDEATAFISRKHLEENEIETRYLQALRSSRKDDIARGFTTVGPHRDDIRFLSNNTDLGYYGSRGQIRTALIALKLAEASWLEKTTSQTPVLLFDEVLAELDQQRRSDLLERLNNAHQVFLTTTNADLFTSEYQDLCETWNIQNGIVHVD